jgi:hypothetical protein
MPSKTHSKNAQQKRTAKTHSKNAQQKRACKIGLNVNKLESKLWKLFSEKIRKKRP